MPASLSSAKAIFGEFTYIYQEISLPISYIFREGKKGNIFYIHGLGCSKNDFREAFDRPELREYGLLAFDFPGCGQSPYPQDHPLNLDDLTAICNSVLQKFNINAATIIAHSMGGAIALLLNEKFPGIMRGFIDIEGNLGPKDCFWSRKVVSKNFTEFEQEIFPKLKKNLGKLPSVGAQRYAETLEKFSSARAYYDYSQSLVDYSDKGDLLEKFLHLALPKLFVYGSQNAKSLAYLKKLKQYQILTTEIAESNHSPFHDNPESFYSTVANFLKRI